VRKLAWDKNGWSDYLYWRRVASALVQRQDKKTFNRINRLVQNALVSPFDGIGKPEPLKENLSGYWSRRIDETNRLVYQVTDEYITVISCRYHY
jgi:toxin YoeB